MIGTVDLMAEAATLKVAARGNETRRRTVIGRVYYAAYHAALTVALEVGYRYRREPDRPPGRHGNLIAWAVTQREHEGLREAASLLTDIKALRRIADYDLSLTVTYGDVEDSLEKAGYILSELLAGQT
jgi:uncharacterized protein (UPF0332 family)